MEWSNLILGPSPARSNRTSDGYCITIPLGRHIKMQKVSYWAWCQKRTSLMKPHSFQSDQGISTGIVESSHCQWNAPVEGMGDTLEPPRRTGGHHVRASIVFVSGCCDSTHSSLDRRLLGSPDPSTLLSVLIFMVNCIHKSDPRLYVSLPSSSILWYWSLFNSMQNTVVYFYNRRSYMYFIAWPYGHPIWCCWREPWR